MTNEKRLIDANAIKYQEHRECAGHGLYFHYTTVTKEEVDKMPTVDAVEVVHGRWDEGVCTHCSFDIRCLTDGESDLEAWVWDEGFDYCPCCGAKMDGDGNG